MTALTTAPDARTSDRAALDLLARLFSASGSSSPTILTKPPSGSQLMDHTISEMVMLWDPISRSLPLITSPSTESPASEARALRRFLGRRSRAWRVPSARFSTMASICGPSRSSASLGSDEPDGLSRRPGASGAVWVSGTYVRDSSSSNPSKIVSSVTATTVRPVQMPVARGGNPKPNSTTLVPVNLAVK